MADAAKTPVRRFAVVEFDDMDTGKRVRIAGVARIKTGIYDAREFKFVEVTEPELGPIRSRIIWCLGALAHLVRGPLVRVSEVAEEERP